MAIRHIYTLHVFMCLNPLKVGQCFLHFQHHSAPFRYSSHSAHMLLMCKLRYQNMNALILKKNPLHSCLNLDSPDSVATAVAAILITSSPKKGNSYK